MNRSRFFLGLVLILSVWLPNPSLADQPPSLEACTKTTSQTTHWGAEQIAASRTLDADYVAVDAPIWTADTANITLVVETGDHHVSVLDGDTFKRLDRFATPIGVYADPVFSGDGRYVFILSCDGWVQKYDIWSLRQVGRVRAGLRARNIAVSVDGKWLAIANTLPKALTILSTEDLSVATVIEVKGGKGAPSRAAGVYNNPPRESFILALMDAPKIWEIFYGANPPQMGFAHDWRTEGPVPQSTPFPIRKITTADHLDDFVFDPTFEYVAGAARKGGGMVIDLVIGLKQADIDLTGRPLFGKGFAWKRGGANVIAVPHLTVPRVSVIDTKTWQVVMHIPTQGVGQIIRSHEGSEYLWVTVAIDENQHSIHLIDKQTLKIGKTLGPMRRADMGGVAFSKDGGRVLISVGKDDGAVIVYDAISFAKITSLPMRKPSGIFTVGNRVDQQ